jgi:hypothetical protein
VQASRWRFEHRGCEVKIRRRCSAARAVPSAVPLRARCRARSPLAVTCAQLVRRSVGNASVGSESR